jgi:adenylyltransferase/sulfurtransferase
VPSCAEGGVLGILPGVIGLIQATEAVKLILGKGEPLIGRLLHYDALAMTFRTYKVRRNANCPICGENPTIKSLIDYDQFCGIRGEETPKPEERSNAMLSDVTVEELKQRLDRGENVFILDVRNPPEIAICRIEGSTVVPLPDLPQRFRELDIEREIVVHCKSGMRSAKAVAFLREQGYTNVRNLKGGILEWAAKIDKNMPTY